MGDQLRESAKPDVVSTPVAIVAHANFHSTWPSAISSDGTDLECAVDHATSTDGGPHTEFKPPGGKIQVGRPKNRNERYPAWLIADVGFSQGSKIVGVAYSKCNRAVLYGAM